jgi:hypothetical protein
MHRNEKIERSPCGSGRWGCALDDTSVEYSVYFRGTQESGETIRGAGPGGISSVLVMQNGGPGDWLIG